MSSSPGAFFHVIECLVKKSLLKFNLNLPWCDLKPFPLTLLLYVTFLEKDLHHTGTSERASALLPMTTGTMCVWDSLFVPTTGMAQRKPLEFADVLGGVVTFF